MLRRENSKIEADEILDIRGEVCPFTFIETKLKLEEMEIGKVLEVIIDNEPASRDVPKSLEQEGHEVLGVFESSKGEWRIFVRKV